MRIKIMAILLFIAFFASGCVGSPVHTRHIAPGKTRNAMLLWNGRIIDNAVSRWGPPSQITEYKGDRYFKWVTNYCSWWFNVDNADRITSSGYEGDVATCFNYLAR